MRLIQINPLSPSPEAGHPVSVQALAHVVFLLPLEAEHSHEFLPERCRLLGQRSLVLVDDGLVPDEVGLGGGDDLGAPEQLPERVQDDVEDQHGVERKERPRALVEPGHERGVAVGQLDEAHPHEAGPGAVGLEIALVGKRVTADALRLHRLVEEDVGYAHDHVVDHLSTLGQGLEPSNHHCCVRRHLQEREEREDHDHGKGVDRNAVLETLLEDGGRVAVEGKTVERSHGAVGVSVSGTEDTGAEQGVHDGGQNRDTHVGHSNDVGRSIGSSRVVVSQSLVVVRQDDADGKCAPDEEETEPPVNRLEALLEVSSRMLRLAGNHG